jgi:hypothetical protein
LSKEHDEKMIFNKSAEGYNVDFSDLHIINICNEEKEKKTVQRRTSID